MLFSGTQIRKTGILFSRSGAYPVVGKKEENHIYILLHTYTDRECIICRIYKKSRTERMFLLGIYWQKKHPMDGCFALKIKVFLYFMNKISRIKMPYDTHITHMRSK